MESSIQFISVCQLYPTLCDPMDWSTPGFPVHHQLLEFTQTHVHQVCDDIQPSHLLSSPFPPAFNLSWHQSLFQWVSSSHQVAKIGVSASASVLPMNIQDWFPLGRTGWIPLQFKGLSRDLQHHSSKASILQHSAFFIVQLSHPYTTTGKTIALTRRTFVGEQNGGCLENYAAIIWPCNPTRAYNICGEKHGLKGYCTPMFITALSTIAKTRKQPKCPWTEERIKMGIYTPWNITRP